MLPTSFFACDKSVFAKIQQKYVYMWMHTLYYKYNTEFSESLAAREASSSKFPKTVENQEIPRLRSQRLY